VSQPLASAGAAPLPPAAPNQAAAGLQALVDQYRLRSGGRAVVGSLPVHVTFPSIGPAMFLAAELTAEGSSPSIELLFKRSGK
jgi:hypothetical protein